jgi:hypothetical protein
MDRPIKERRPEWIADGRGSEPDGVARAASGQRAFFVCVEASASFSEEKEAKRLL